MNFDANTQPNGGPILGPPPARSGDVRLVVFLFVGVLDLAFILVAILALSNARVRQERQIPAELVSGAAARRGVAFELPTVSGADPLAPGPRDVVVNVSAEGRLFAGGQWRSMEDFRERLARLDESVAVLIRADADTPHRHILALLAACRKAGIVRVGFVTQPAPAGEDAGGTE